MRISDWSSDVCSSDLEGFAVDEVAQCTGLAAQVTDHVPEIDAMPPVGMTDPHTRRGHYPVRAEEELDAIVKEMRVEAQSDEAGRHRIGNTIDGDGDVAGDIDGDHGEIGDRKSTRLTYSH